MAAPWAGFDLYSVVTIALYGSLRLVSRADRSLSPKGTETNESELEYFVDVKDTARLHVAGLLNPAISNERLFAYAASFNVHEIVDVLRKLRPEDTRVADAPENEGRDLTDVKPAKRAEQVIKEFFGANGWTSLEDSLAAGIAGYAVDR